MDKNLLILGIVFFKTLNYHKWLQAIFKNYYYANLRKKVQVLSRINTNKRAFEKALLF